MRKFVNTAHENNIRVVMDVVVNHAGYNTIGICMIMDFQVMKHQ